MVPFRCGSRRHAGACATRWRRTLFCRLRDGAMATADPADVLFSTWTMPTPWHRPHTELPRGHWTREDWQREAKRHETSTRECSRLVAEHFRQLNQCLTRRGYPRLRYAWVVEAHRSGVTHAHAIVVSTALASMHAAERGERATEKSCEPCELWAATAPAGFGRCDLSIARDAGKLASYVAKLCGEVAKTGGGQLVHGRHQRTYGASRGMLAPRRKSLEYTAALVTRAGTPVVQARPLSPLARVLGRMVLVVEDGDVQRCALGTTRAHAIDLARALTRAPSCSPPTQAPSTVATPRPRRVPYTHDAPRVAPRWRNAWPSPVAGARGP